MSNSSNPITELPFTSLTINDTINKPDFKELDYNPGPGSPISPLTTRPTISTSSCSSGSFSGRPGTRISYSGELSVDSSPTFSISGSRVNPGHTQPESGSSYATSLPVNVLPAGNICRSGRVLKTGMMLNRSSKPEVLSLGSGNYGHGSIMRGGSGSGSGSMDGEELKRLGNEEYKKGCYLEALRFYDKAILLSPVNAAYHSNRAAALIGLKRLSEAVKECYEAIRLDDGYVRAHHRLGSLLVR